MYGMDATKKVKLKQNNMNRKSHTFNETLTRLSAKFISDPGTFELNCVPEVHYLNLIYKSKQLRNF